MFRHAGRLSRLALASLAAATLVGAAPAKPTQPVLPFIHDDYAKALQQARASKRPIFVESWAPW